MNSFRIRALGLGAAIAVVAVSASFAQDKISAVNARQDFMKMQGADLKAISDYAKGQGDQATALAKAQDFQALTARLTTQFPQGTSSTDFPGKSKAKPELFTSAGQDDVKAIQAAMQAEEPKLIDAIKAGNMQAVGDTLGAISKAGCGACHSKYRLPAS